MYDIANAWANVVVDIINTPVLGTVFMFGLGFIILTCTVRLCINTVSHFEQSEMNKKVQMQMKIKAVQMLTNLTPEEAAERIADIYEEYLREENNNE